VQGGGEEGDGLPAYRQRGEKRGEKAVKREIRKGVVHSSDSNTRKGGGKKE